MTRTTVALFALAILGLAACGSPTGPPGTGANSSAPNAVESADHGNAGGGVNANTPTSSETPKTSTP